MTGITFFISGLFHEYTIWIRQGTSFGYQIVFFMLQYVGIIIEQVFMIHRLPNIGRQIFGRIFLFTWLGLTLKFFFYGIDNPIEELLVELQK